MTMQGKKHSLETRKKMSEAWKHRTPTNLGKTFSQEWKKNLSISHKGQSSAMKGKKLSEEAKKKISQNRKGKGMGNQNSKGYKHTREHIRKSLRRRPMSSLEVKFSEIVNDLNLPYRFVGNGDFFIERKNPDFINTNGEKIAVEVYYKRHKDLFGGSCEKWKENRQKIFSQYGWEIEFFDAPQVNSKEIETRLGGV